MGFSTVRSTEMEFGIYSVGGEVIDKNSTVMLNNWAVESMKTATVSPCVDRIRLIPWDADQSSDEYSEVLLPLDSSGSSHHTIRYMTNNPVEIYRHKNSSSTPYLWRVKYDGYDYVRSLSETAQTYELKAGKRTVVGSGSILQGNLTSSWAIDDFVRVRHEITNNGTTVNMQLQVFGGVYKCVHKYINQNTSGVTRVIGNITGSVESFIIDASSTDGETAQIDTYIHSTSDGSGPWRYKYKGIFTHHSNNNMYWTLEAEYNPAYVV